jgi:hypothetical protein
MELLNSLIDLTEEFTDSNPRNSRKVSRLINRRQSYRYSLVRKWDQSQKLQD